MADCEGNACDVVSVTWDSGAGKFLVSNHAPSRRVRVELHNGVVTDISELNPGQSAHSFVTTYIHPYRANYI